VDNSSSPQLKQTITTVSPQQGAISGERPHLGSSWGLAKQGRMVGEPSKHGGTSEGGRRKAPTLA
jgi:hypothetical protein